MVGRTTHYARGLNSDFEVVVRDSGFDYQRCCGYSPTAPKTSVEYDPNNKVYPFKRTNTPQKVWFSPDK